MDYRIRFGQAGRWAARAAAVVAAAVFLLGSTVAFAAPVELTLEKAIDLALKNNPTVKMAQADKEKSAWAVTEAKAGLFSPSFTYTHQATYLKTTPAGGSLVTNNFDNRLAMSLPLYTGGKVEGGIDQAKLNFKVSELALDLARQQVKLNATTAYFSLLQARDVLALNQEAVDRLKAHLENVKAQYSVGTVAKLDVLQSEVDLANAEQALIKAQNSYDVAMATLNNVIQLPHDTELAVKEQLKYEKYTKTLDECLAYALKNRPDIIQAQLNLDIAKEGKRVAAAGNVPSLAFNAYYDTYDRPFAGFGNDNNVNWSTYLTLTWNLFDSGLTKSRVKEAVAAMDKASQQMKQTTDSVLLSVRQAYLGLREAEKRISTSQVAVNQAEEAYKIAEVRYSAGVGTNLDVMDAQYSLTQAKTNYVQALYDYNTSWATLENAMGVPVK